MQRKKRGRRNFLRSHFFAITFWPPTNNMLQQQRGTNVPMDNGDA